MAYVVTRLCLDNVDCACVEACPGTAPAELSSLT